MVALYIAAGLITAGLLYILFVPVHIEMRFSIERRSLDRTFIRFFPFRYNIKTRGGPKKIEEISEEIEKSEKGKFRPPEFLVNLIRVLMEETRTIYRVIFVTFKLLKGVLRSPSYGVIRVSLNGGLGEPELTGWFYGSLCMAKPIIGKTIAVHYNPDYLADGIGGEITGSAMIRLINIIKELLLFIVRLPKLKLIKAYWRIRKGGKDGR
jgi:hypothetical protein